MPDLYNAIFRRKSIRQYNMTPLDTLQDIQDFIDALTPMFPDIQVHFEYAVRQDIMNLLPVAAPHYLVAFSEKKDGYLLNMGFMMQQIDLYLSSRGLGSCWLGVALPHSEFRHRTQLSYVIMLAFGRPQSLSHRQDVQEFKRKTPEEIASSPTPWLEAVRLAPSATNRQPWYFIGDESHFHAYCLQHHLINALIYGRLHQIDMGIALCHLWLAVMHDGGRVEFNNMAGRPEPPKGYTYAISGIIRQNDSIELG